MSHSFFGMFQLGGLPSHLYWFVFWNDAEEYFLEYLPKQKECLHVSDSNKRYQRTKPSLGANEKTTVIEVIFIIAVAQHFEKYLQVF